MNATRKDCGGSCGGEGGARHGESSGRAPGSDTGADHAGEMEVPAASPDSTTPASQVVEGGCDHDFLLLSGKPAFCKKCGRTREQIEGPTLTREEAMRESSFIAGAMEGFRLGANDDREGLNFLVASREGYLKHAYPFNTHNINP